MNHDLSLKEIKKEWHGTLKSYLIGFVLSILLTAISFLLVVTNLFSAPIIRYAIIGLALVQAIIQLLFFLHLGQEARPRWETVVFCFMVIVLLTIVAGSLWIMDDLNYRTMKGMTHD